MSTTAQDTLRTRFEALVKMFDSIAEVERLTGRSRRSIEYKLTGERRIEQYDILALERALQIKQQPE